MPLAKLLMRLLPLPGPLLPLLMMRLPQLLPPNRLLREPNKPEMPLRRPLLRLSRR